MKDSIQLNPYLAFFFSDLFAWECHRQIKQYILDVSYITTQTLPMVDIIWYDLMPKFCIVLQDLLIDLEEFSTTVCTHSIMCSNKNLPLSVKCFSFSSSIVVMFQQSISFWIGVSLQLLLFWCLFCLKFKFVLFPMHVITPTPLNISIKLNMYYSRSCFLTP